MRAFLKTLFGDRDTVAVVASVMLVEWLLVESGAAPAAGFVTPALALLGAVWLAGR